MKNRPIRVAFINSGILGHGSVLKLFEQILSLSSAIEPNFIDLSEKLSVYERAIRRLICLRPTRLLGSHLSNWDLARWRHELHCGIIAARRLKQQERKGKRFDVLHFHPQPAAYFSLPRMRETPSIVSIDCTSFQARDEASIFERPTYFPNLLHDRLVFRAAAAIVCTSAWAGASLAKQYPECADKIQVIPYPVAMGVFQKDWAQERSVGHKSQKHSPARVLFMGGDFTRKGGEELLEAWREGKFGVLHQLSLVTNQVLDPRSLPEGVTVVPRVLPFSPDWFSLWREADLFVMPSRNEAFGMVYQEAAAAGLPVIATNINAVPEIVEHGKTGLLVPKGDRQALITALRTLLGDADLRCRMGAAARKRAQILYPPEGYREKIVGLIQKVAADYRTVPRVASRPFKKDNAKKV